MQDLHSGRITCAYCSATYERIALRIFIVPPHSGGKVVAPATKGEMHFLERSKVGLFSHGRKPGCEGFIIRGRLL